MSRGPDEHASNRDPASNVGPAGVRYYYVDEAGDPVLFNAKGRVIVGDEGCSRFFILGMLDVVDPDAVAIALNELRQRLLADPYLDVPSMRPKQRKTARMFHAKDDIPEVRQEVFKLLAELDVRFYAIVRDKKVIVEKVLEFNKKNPNYRYHPNQLYDRSVPLLFQERLHQHKAYRIVFATRGSKDRTQAFENGLLQAKARFRRKNNVDEGTAPIEVVALESAKVTCLQAADYFLWALQRCFGRRERRYLDLLWPKVGLILDRDDTHTKGTGEYYTRKNPIPEDFREDDAKESTDGGALKNRRV